MQADVNYMTTRKALIPRLGDSIVLRGNLEMSGSCLGSIALLAKLV